MTNIISHNIIMKKSDLQNLSQEVLIKIILNINKMNLG